MGFSRINHIAAKDVPAHWEAIRPYIERSQKYGRGESSVDDIHQDLLSGHMQAWTMNDPELVGVILTKILFYAEKKTLVICGIAGTDANGRGDEIDLVMGRFAKHMGCKDIEVTGRKGWIKRLARYGYQHAWTTVTRNVE